MPKYDMSGQGGEVIDLAKAVSRHRSTITILAVALLATVGAWTSYYQVEPAEVGVVQRFGAHLGNTEPGPHFKIPFGVDTVRKVPVRNQIKLEFGFRTTKASVKSEFSRTSEASKEAEMLTGDLNVAMVEWTIQYTIRNPEHFVFNFRDVESTLRLASEATMRAVVGDHSIDELLTGGREGIEQEGLARLQEFNDKYETGINLEQVKLQDVNVPDPVKPAMREVEEAKQERERLINEAWSEYNKVIPKAEGSALQMIQAAEGYAVERINRATGDAERFRALYAEYRKAPEVTRTRLYLEALTSALPRARRKVVVDDRARQVLPLLNLDGGK